MSSLLACRICLGDDVRLYSLSNSSLQDLYEKIADVPLHTDDRKPTTVCYICYHQLRKCQDLVYKSQKAEELLTNLLKRNDELTEVPLSLKSYGLDWNFNVSTSAVAVGGTASVKVHEQETDETRYNNIQCEIEMVKVEPCDIDETVVKQEIVDEELDTFGNNDEVQSSSNNVSILYSQHGSEDFVQVETNLRNNSYYKNEERLMHMKNDVPTASDIHNFVGIAVDDLERPHKCSYCGKKFAEEVHLNTHLRTHTGGKPFECKYCDRCFTNQSLLAIHTKTHTGDMPYECEFCDKRFSQRIHLTKHEGTHTGKRPFECGFCHKRFSRNNHLTKHIRVHTGEKPFKCDFCGKSFSDQCYLTTHIRIHTGEKPHECKFCDKSFHCKGDLTSHTRTHTGERPYECGICLKRFSLQTNLTKHSRIHTGEKLYQCNVCQKRLCHQSALIRHLKIHKNDETSSKN